MAKSSKVKLGSDFWIVSITTIVSVLLSVVLFKYDKWILEPKILRQEVREQVGVVSEVRRKPKRRYAGSLTYLDVQTGEKILLGDSLFMDATSHLEFKLQSGSTLRLGSMTLVLVDRENNQIKLILNNGELLATLAENDRVLVDVDEETLEFTGDPGTTFKVTKADLGETQVLSETGKVKLRFREQDYTLNQTPLDLKDPTKPAPEPTAPPAPKLLTEATLSSKAPPPPPAPIQTPAERVAPKAKPLIPSEVVNLDDIPLDVPIPYPANKQLFLIKQKSSIIIMPRRLCKTDCRVTLYKGETEMGQWTFQKDSPPLLKLPFSKEDAGEYTVKLEEEQESSTQFDVEPFSTNAFEQAIKKGLSVELLD